MAQEVQILDRWGQPMEKRSDLRNPDPWLWEYFTGGTASAAGEPVNARIALTVATFFACVNNISMDLAMLPKSVRRKLTKGNEDIPGHPVAQLFNQPNDYTDRHSFWQTFFSHALMFQGAYAEIEFGDDGQPVALHLIDPASVTCRWVEGKEVYYVNVFGDHQVILMDWQVLCLHGLGYDTVTGYSIPHLSKQILGLAIALQKFQGAFFANGASPSGILKHPSILNAEAVDRLRRQFEERYSGSLHSHKPMMLEDGLDFQPITMDNDKTQMVDLSKVPPLEICKMFRMPPSKAGIMEGSNFSSLEQQEQQYDSDVIAPWDHKFRSVCDFRLLVDRERRQGFKTYQNINALHRADIKTKDDHFKNMFYMSIYSPNDILELEDRNPIDGGDRRFMQRNLIPFDRVDEVLDKEVEQGQAPRGTGDDQPGSNPPEPDAPSPDTPAQRAIRDGFKQMIELNIQRLLRVEAKKASASTSIEEFYESQRIYVKGPVFDCVEIVASAFCIEADSDGLAARYAEIHCNKSKTDILAGDVTSWQDGSRASASADWLISKIIGDEYGNPAQHNRLAS